MCGIVGFVGEGTRDDLFAMTRALAHRGPDDAGYALFRAARDGGPDGGYWSQFTEAAFRERNRHLPVWGGSYYSDEVARIDFTLGQAEDIRDRYFTKYAALPGWCGICACRPPTATA